MRDFNKVNPSLWGSQKFSKLSQADKLLYFYFLTCPHSNSAGFFRCPIGYMTSDLKMEEETLRKGIERVCDTLLIGYDFNEETVLLYQWFRFNPPSNPNHAKKVFNDILGLSDCDLKFQCLQQFKECLTDKGWKIPEELEIILKGYRKGIERVSPLEETRPDQTRPEETETRPLKKDSSVFSEEKKTHESEFEEFWKSWIAYKTGKGSKADAKAIYLKIRKEIYHDTIINGAKEYCAFCKATDCNTKNVFRWLKKQGWNDDYKMPERGSAANTEQCYSDSLLAATARARELLVQEGG